MEVESRFYHYGLGARLPYGALNSIANAVDSARNAFNLARRRKLAREMLLGSPWLGFIPKECGYALLMPETLPGTEAALDSARTIIEDRRKTGWKARLNNPFFQCERAEDFRDHPALIEFALSDAVLHIMSDYYGLVPQLKEIGIWLTPPQERQFSSQLYHLDKPETQIVGLFLNVDSNDAYAGPLTLLPANVSTVVRQKTRYESIYFRGDGRLADETVFTYCSPEDAIVLGGPRGSGGFADTSNCFHYGSRCKVGERKMLVIKFMLPHKARHRRTPIFDLVPPPDNEVRRLVLSGAKFSH
jgi:hypothetical protein